MAKFYIELSKNNKVKMFYDDHDMYLNFRQ